jgi:hypothetical protein
MSKPTFLISCPIDTYSGYGSRSRDIVKAIIELDKYEVKILPQRWGQTPKGFIQNNPEWGFLSKHILTFNHQTNLKFGCKLQFQMNFNLLENITLDVPQELNQLLPLVIGLKVAIV